MTVNSEGKLRGLYSLLLIYLHADISRAIPDFLLLKLSPPELLLAEPSSREPREFQCPLSVRGWGENDRGKNFLREDMYDHLHDIVFF
jgi:hypothetical protein